MMIVRKVVGLWYITKKKFKFSIHSLQSYPVLIFLIFSTKVRSRFNYHTSASAGVLMVMENSASFLTNGSRSNGTLPIN